MIEKMLVLHSSAVSDSTWKKLKKNKLETICYKKDTYGFLFIVRSMKIFQKTSSAASPTQENLAVYGFVLI